METRQGVHVPRNVLLAVGALLWASFALWATLHVIAGDWLGPLIALIVVLPVFALRHARRRSLGTS